MKKRMLIAGLLAAAMLLISCGAESDTSVAVPEQSDDGSSAAVMEASSAETTGASESEAETSSFESSEANSVADEPEPVESSADDPSQSEGSSKEPVESSKGNVPGTSSESDTSKPQPTGTGTHKHSYKDTVVKPTCTEKGYTLHKCSCGESYTDQETEALGHEYSWGYVTKKPTETERGETEYDCDRCGETVTVKTHSIAEAREIFTEQVVYWLNYYRAEEGSSALTQSKKLTELAQYRATQALQGGNHAGHNSADMAKAAEATKCGIFHDYTYLDPVNEELITPYWRPSGMEAYASGFSVPILDVGGDYTDIGKSVVEGFRHSSGHWAYLGGTNSSYSNYVYVGVGISNGNCFIIVNSYNPDKMGYEHYYLDGNGDLCHEWVMP